MRSPDYPTVWQRAGAPCPVPRCTQLITQNKSFTCSQCLHVMKSMCRGKARLGYRAAKDVMRRNGDGLNTYQCPVCDEWHVGSVTADPEARQLHAATVRAYMIDTYGEPWWREHVLDHWDPDSGYFRRSGTHS